MSETLTAEHAALFAAIGGTLDNGRHAWRMRDESAKVSAQALAAESRRADDRLRKERKRAEEREERARVAAWRTYDASLVCERSSHGARVVITYRTAVGYDSVTVAARKRDEAVEEILAAMDAVGMGAHADSVTVADAPPCCAYALIQAAWNDAPSRKSLKDAWRALVSRDADVFATRGDWRSLTRAYRDSRAVTRALGSFALSRDDMTLSSASRFYKRAAYLLSLTDAHLNPAFDAEDVTQDAFVSALESPDGLTFGNMFRHIRGSVTSAPFRYRRMGNGHRSDNVTDWTWSDWEEWAKAQNVGDVAFSTLPEWQAYDAAKMAHEADAAYRRRVEERRDAEASYMDTARASLVTLIREGYTVRRIAHILGRTPEGILKGLNVEDATRRI